MLDIGWSELFIIAVVAIVIIGPKDLPKTLRMVGKWVAKARATAREFQSSVDEMIAQSELDELRNEANSIANFDTSSYLNEQVDPTGPSNASSTTAQADDGDDDETHALSERTPTAPPNSIVPPPDADAVPDVVGAEPAETADSAAQEPGPKREASA